MNDARKPQGARPRWVPLYADATRAVGLAAASVFGAIVFKIGGKEQAPVSMATIATLTGQSRATVRRAIERIRKAGLISRINTNGRTPTYTVTPDWQVIADRRQSEIGNRRQIDTGPVSNCNRSRFQNDAGHAPICYPRSAQELEEGEQPPPKTPAVAGRVLIPDWSEADRALAINALTAEGVKLVKPTAKEAEQNGYSAGEVVETCREYRANRSKFNGPEAIVYRIREGHWPANNVRPAARMAPTGKRPPARSTSFGTEAVASRSADAAEEDRIERDYGPMLDGMSDEDVNAVAMAVLPPTLTCAARDHRTTGLARLLLLKELEQRAHQEGEKREETEVEVATRSTIGRACIVN